MEENQRGSHELSVQPPALALASSKFCPKEPLNRLRNPITSEFPFGENPRFLGFT